MIRHEVNPERAALEAGWWKDWWAQDFSWDGLIAKPVTFRNVKTNLQALWRGEADRLIAEPGTPRRWTRAHCPLVFADGTPSPKAGWPAAEWDVLASEIAHFGGPLDGMVGPLSAMSGQITARHAYLTGDVSLSGLSAIDLTNSWLCGNLSAPEKANLDRLDLARTCIEGAVILMGLVLNDVRCVGARFLGDVSFERSRFGADMHIADFSAALFASQASFAEADFVFEALFNGARFAGPASFFGVRFEDRARFDNILCLDDINFYKAAFVRRLTINESSFYGRANFEGITDGDPISLSPQSIQLVPDTNLEPTGLSGTIAAPSGPSERSFRSLPKLLARRAVFYEDANFSNRDLLSPSTFQFARFLHRGRFHGSDVHASVNFHGTRFGEALTYQPRRLPKYPDDLLRLHFSADATATDYAAWKKAYAKGRTARRSDDFTADGYYDGLEASFRTLKQLMEDRRDRVREGDFFNLELRARRKRGDIPAWERVASLIYGGVADYGNSLFRPLLLIVLLNAGLAGVYYAAAEVAVYHQPLTPFLDAARQGHLLSACNFSLQNVFAPFSALDAGKFSAKDVWVGNLVFSASPGLSLGVKLIAAVQSLLTIALAFLAGLAGRRRFQIN